MTTRVKMNICVQVVYIKRFHNVAVFLWFSLYVSNFTQSFNALVILFLFKLIVI